MKRYLIAIACMCLVWHDAVCGGLPESNDATEVKSEVVHASNEYYVYKASPYSVQMAWKDGKGNIISNIKNLDVVLAGRGQKLLCAMNGGMYTKEQGPCGLYIENGMTKHSLNKNFSGSGNFCTGFGEEKTNGVFVTNVKNKK